MDRSTENGKPDRKRYTGEIPGATVVNSFCTARFVAPELPTRGAYSVNWSKKYRYTALWRFSRSTRLEFPPEILGKPTREFWLLVVFVVEIGTSTFFVLGSHQNLSVMSNPTPLRFKICVVEGKRQNAGQPNSNIAKIKISQKLGEKYKKA